MERFSVFSFRNKLPEEVEIIVVTVGVVSSFTDPRRMQNLTINAFTVLI